MSEFVHRYRHPASWTPRRIGDVCTRITTRYSGGETVVLTASAERGLVDQREYFKRRVASKDLSTYYEIEKGDFAYNKSYSSGYPFGVIARLEDYPKGVVSPLYICFRASDPQVDPDYLAHAFEAGILEEQLQNITKEGSRNHGLLNIRVGDFFDAELHLPDKDQQRRIAEIFSTVDEAIEHTEALIAKTQQIKTGLMHDLFTRGVTPDGRLRPPRDQAPELYKQSPLGWIPREWEIRQVGDAVSKIDAGWSPECIEIPPAQGEWGVLKVSSVTSGEFCPEEAKTLPANLDPIPSLEVNNGDVILARANGVAELVGITAEVRSTQDRLMLSDKLLRLQPNRGVTNSGFLAGTMMSPCVRRQVAQLLSGSSGQRNISQSAIRSIIAPLPVPREQAMVVRFTANFYERVRLLSSERRKLLRLKRGLLTALLSSNVRDLTHAQSGSER